MSSHIAVHVFNYIAVHVLRPPNPTTLSLPGRLPYSTFKEMCALMAKNVVYLALVDNDVIFRG